MIIDITLASFIVLGTLVGTFKMYGFLIEKQVI